MPFFKIFLRLLYNNIIYNYLELYLFFNQLLNMYPIPRQHWIRWSSRERQTRRGRTLFNGIKIDHLIKIFIFALEFRDSNNIIYI